MKKWIILTLVVLATLVDTPGRTQGFASEFFPIDLEKKIGGLDLEVSTQQTGRTAIVSILNRTARTVHCRARFHNGPELPRWRQGRIEGSASIILSHTAKRPVIRMDILLECVPGREDR